MLIYIITFLFIIGLGLVTYSSKLYETNKHTAKKRYIQGVCFILILISGLRNVSVGEDTYGYYLNYQEIEKTPWKVLFTDLLNYLTSGEGKDVGYPIFVKATQIISSNFQFFLLFIACFFYFILGDFVNKNTRKLTDAIIAFTIFYVLFFYVFSITAIRQSLTLAATLFCFELIKKKKILPFLIIIFLFSLIHKSVLVFIPFYFLCRLKNTKFVFTLVLVLFPVIMIFRNYLTFFLIGIGGYEEYEEFKGAGTFTFTAIFIFISIVALLKRKIILKQNPVNINYYNAFAVSLLLLPLSWINPSLLRITMYFSVFMILLIPEIIQSFQTISVRIRRNLVVVSVMILFLLYFKANYSKENSDYRFFWEEIKLGKNYE